MKNLKYLRVHFDSQLQPFEIPAFRGAIAHKVGLDESILFHNHMGDRLRYSYPLIQYSAINGQPAIVCLGEGVEEIHKFFAKRNWEITLSERTLDMKISRMEMQHYTMQVWNKTFSYGLKNWVALNQKSYDEYRKLDGVADQVKMLESKLIGNILSMAKGIEWTIDKTISCQITDLPSIRPVTVKGIKMLGFSLTFKTNVFLPPYIGLGNKVSLGYGTVIPL